MDEAATMGRVIALTGQVVDRIEPDQLDNPSPCTEWTVRDVSTTSPARRDVRTVRARRLGAGRKLGELMTGDNLGDDYKARSTAADA
jgi:hypothetical protein